MNLGTVVTAGLLPICRVLVTVLNNRGEEKYWSSLEEYGEPAVIGEGSSEELGAGISMLATIGLTILVMRKGKGGIVYTLFFHIAYTWLLEAINDVEVKAWPATRSRPV